uniref:tigger transposable element-derived protein 1-like n=1 Tax=Myxine glutinosa TaxID=7769 RepID=UPI00358FE200
MAPKRKTSAGDASTSKMQKKVLSLNQKVELLNRILRGESAAFVGRHYGVHESTIRYIRKNEKAIRECFSERCIDGPLIHEKAKLIYDQLSGTGGASTSDALSDNGTNSATSFTASRGWFHRIKERYCLKNVKLSGERASADHEVAKVFPAQLTRLIEEKGYRPEQVFNADETGLFWKRMATRTFI